MACGGHGVILWLLSWCEKKPGSEDVGEISSSCIPGLRSLFFAVFESWKSIAKLNE